MEYSNTRRLIHLDAIVIIANLCLARVEVLSTPRHNSSFQQHSTAARDMQIMTRIVTSFHCAIDTISLASMTDAAAHPDGCVRSRQEVHGRPCLAALRRKRKCTSLVMKPIVIAR